MKYEIEYSAAKFMLVGCYDDYNDTPHMRQSGILNRALLSILTKGKRDKSQMSINRVTILLGTLHMIKTDITTSDGGMIRLYSSKPLLKHTLLDQQI